MKTSEPTVDYTPNAQLDEARSHVTRLLAEVERLERENEQILAQLAGKKSECKCTFAQRATGDGCEVCNPERALEFAKDTIKELQAEVDRFEHENERLRNDVIYCLHVLKEHGIKVHKDVEDNARNNERTA